MGILEPASVILEYYKNNNYEGEDSYIFPILNRTHETPMSKDNRIDKVLKAVNKDLQTIADKLEIKEKLTTYVARHSFATIMRRSGASDTVIKETMGHSDESMTKIYLDDFENKVLDDAVKMIL